MTGFVSRPPAADAQPPAAPPAEVITGDGWWPDIDLAKLREIARIPTTVTPVRLRDSTAAAMLDLNQVLAAWRAPHVEAGWANLHAVPAPEIDGQSRLVFLYTRAIHSTVAADLAEKTKDLTATAAGVDRADELACPADELRRSAVWAMRELQGLPHTTVELI